MSAFDILQAARAPQRPTGRDFISRLTEDFIELHGDRSFGDDGAIIGGINQGLEDHPAFPYPLRQGDCGIARPARPKIASCR